MQGHENGNPFTHGAYELNDGVGEMQGRGQGQRYSFELEDAVDSVSHAHAPAYDGYDIDEEDYSGFDNYNDSFSLGQGFHPPSYAPRELSPERFLPTPSEQSPLRSPERAYQMQDRLDISPQRRSLAAPQDTSQNHADDSFGEEPKYLYYEGEIQPTMPTWRSEPSHWLQLQKVRSKKWRWIIIAVGALLVLLMAGGITAGVLLSRKNSGHASGSSESQSPSQPVAANDPELKALLNNPNLHNVFHGVAYTPLNTVLQYGCGATLRNVTLDLAVLSQVTKNLHIYGTDCNQTELVLDAMNTLNLDMKLSIGIWQDSNQTTNDRQIQLFWQALQKFGVGRISQVMVGNEVLYAKYLSVTQLTNVIDSVRQNLTSKSYNLPVGSLDLGSNWNAAFASKVDVLGANVHPFFGGVTAEKSAQWTWDFFDQNDEILVKAPQQAIISEVGWPSAGGTNQGSVAGISQMQTMLDTFVCQSNAKGIKYYWFEAFDEPWKIVYNTPGKEWEDKWGLFDVNRNLKDGLVIPSC